MVTNGSDPAPDAREQFFFVHVQKTAGTTLLIRLGNQFPPEAIYPDDSDGDKFGNMPQMNVDHLVERWAERSAQIEVVTGPLPPVHDRAARRRLHHLHRPARAGRADAVLPAPPPQDHARGPAPLARGDLRGPAAVRPPGAQPHGEDVRADHRRDDRWRDDHGRLHPRAPRPGAGAAGHASTSSACRRTSSRSAPSSRPASGGTSASRWWPTTRPDEAVSDAFRARIAADNALDVELYEFARELVADRRRLGADAG